MNEDNLDYEKIKGIVALLVHAAKIDEVYSNKEKNIILSFIKHFIKDEDKIKNMLHESEILESNSNQLLSFTDKIKKNSTESKSIVIKELWRIIISDNKADEYESNLMRRICGLIYFPDKLSGEIKTNLLKEIK